MTSHPEAIVDAHHHLWHLGTGRYPWLQDRYDPQSFFLGEYEALCHDFGVDDYLSHWPGVHVDGTVHVEAERERSESLAETIWLHEQHARHGFPSAVVAHVDLLDAGHDASLREQTAYPLVRGVRCKPQIAATATRDVRQQAGSLQDPRWRAGLEALAARGLAWDLRVPFWHLEEAAELIATVPGLRVAVEHTGLPWDRSEAGLAQWLRGMRLLASIPEVHVKLSEFGLPGKPWDRADNVRVIRHAIDVFGAERCMFASNLPVSGLRANTAEIIATMSEAMARLDAVQSRGIWRDNALDFYRVARGETPVDALVDTKSSRRPAGVQA
ncbi:amidohydrolase family protein [Cupriavidus agavae]|uniref:Putative TIM-barrel fold metal-dependent hydrolase n=1 Tax=Cupriavidus agavae TaxID=1001822 RepID=A0A4Q7RPC2_9BURK|nr:amidohydrolase family protein [Cupriavidus agavae]RZT35481.1 putative TIM-barrel fold metal-dependent hydrolase [Cupriavidus agavae]